MPIVLPTGNALVKTAYRLLLNESKRKYREAKKKYTRVNRLKSLPKLKIVYVNSEYVNPVTLNKVPSGPTVYRIRDPKTGRLDYYEKTAFWSLMRRYAPNIKNNYTLMMALPRRTLFPNPTTRSNITTRNIQRVVARPKPKTPTRSAAAARIASALRKKVAARKSH
jgi:hypothetical protein